MTSLTSMTADERRRILDDYLGAVFGDHDSPIAERLRTGAPELPDDPTADQVAAWVELVELLRDPDYVESSRRMAERAQTERVAPDGGHEAAAAIAEHAGAAVRGGVAPDSPEALAVVRHLETVTPAVPEGRETAAERIEAFTDRRVARYWTLVGIINGWPQARSTGVVQLIEAWEWYAQALRAHA